VAAAMLVALLFASASPAATPLPSGPLGEITEYQLPTSEDRSWPDEIVAGPGGKLWFTEWSGVSSVTTSGQFEEFSAGWEGKHTVQGITVGADGNLWMSRGGEGEILRMTPSGALTAFPLPVPGRDPTGITTAADGNVWFTERLGHQIGRISPSGEIVEFGIPGPGSGPMDIAAAADGSLWFTQTSNLIGRLAPDGQISQYVVPIAESIPAGIAIAADGEVWYAMSVKGAIGTVKPGGGGESYAVGGNPTDITAGPYGEMWFTDRAGNSINRINAAGRVERFPLPMATEAGSPVSSEPSGIVLGPDGYLWFTESRADRIGRISPGLPVPENLEAPAVYGDRWEGLRLKARPGLWTQAPTSFGYEWLRCETASGPCRPIPGASDTEYVLREGDVSNLIQVRVTASNAHGAGKPADSGFPGFVRPGGELALTSGTATLVRYRARVSLRCSGGPPKGRCRGTLRLKKKFLVGRARVSVRRGTTKSVSISLSRKGRAMANGSKALRIRALVRSRTGDPKSRPLVLRPPAKSR
jgi:virginiamycin B lyase